MCRLRRDGFGAPAMTTHRVKVDVDTETDRFAVWKDGIGWVEFEVTDLIEQTVAAERARITAGVRVSHSASPIFAHVDSYNLGRVLKGEPWDTDR